MNLIERLSVTSKTEGHKLFDVVSVNVTISREMAPIYTIGNPLPISAVKRNRLTIVAIVTLNNTNEILQYVNEHKVLYVKVQDSILKIPPKDIIEAEYDDATCLKALYFITDGVEYIN